MKDRFQRQIEYLRVSVTQNCNLKCVYCKPDNDMAELDRKMAGICSKTSGDNDCTPLTSEEFEKVIRIMVDLGITRVRITGGEPLTRGDICDIVERISAIPGLDDLSMTTNGISLNRFAKSLKQSGLRRLNISLDSLQRERFRYITGGGNLDSVLKGIEKALDAGLSPIKINTVLVKGLNDNEIDDFMSLAKDKPLEVRFIELMPIGCFGEKNADKIVYNSGIIGSHPELMPVERVYSNHPAEYYSIEGYKGKIGFISPMSHKFCHFCNRVRLTCDGKIKPCLGDNGEVSIVDILRSNPDSLRDAIAKAIYDKPEGHSFGRVFNSVRNMSMIGG
ncbi:MAG: GTP 3',8-cyclase MoaA [Bacillota bacterium]